MRTDEIPSDLGQVEQAAMARMESAITNGIPAAPPEQTAAGSEAPSPPPAAPVPGPVPAAAQPAAVPPSPTPPGTTPVGQPPAPITINPSDLSPEAQAFLKMKGGDVDRALKDALDYNNRLGAKGQAAAIPAAPPPADPNAPPVSTAPPPAEAPQAPPVELPPVDPAAIEGHVTQLLDSDPVAVQKVREFVQIEANLKALPSPNKLAFEIAYVERRLSEEDVKADEFGLQAQFRESLRALKEQRSDRQYFERELAQKRAEYNGRADQYRERVEGLYQDQRRQQESDLTIERHAQALQTTWPIALRKTIERHAFTPKQAEAFERRAFVEARGNVEAAGQVIADVDGFMDGVAQTAKQEWDEAHREMSAVYGQQAVARAAQPGLGTSGPSPTPALATAQAPPAYQSLDDFYSHVEQGIGVNR